jgi:hypothetical protein
MNPIAITDIMLAVRGNINPNADLFQVCITVEETKKRLQRFEVKTIKRRRKKNVAAA